MLDDDRLAEMIKALGDAVDIPAGGPERILQLAATPQGETGVAPIVRQYRILAAAVIVVVLGAGSGLLLVGRSGSTGQSAHFGASLAGPATTIPGQFNAATSGASSAGSPGTASGGVASGADKAANVPAPAPPQGGPPIPALPAAAPRVIKTGEVDLVVDAGRVSPTLSQLTTVAAGLNGYVQEAKSSEGVPNPTGDVTIRVPSNQFEALVAKVRSLGKPTSVTTSGQDVTAQYVDLQARITSLQASRDRYLEILRRASTIGDVLAVQQQIDGIQTQLEQAQGQLNVLANQTSYSTLAVHVSTAATTLGVTNPPAASGLAKAWAHARHSLSSGLESVIAASGGLAVFLLVTAALALIARLVWVVVRRRLV